MGFFLAGGEGEGLKQDMRREISKNRMNPARRICGKSLSENCYILTAQHKGSHGSALSSGKIKKKHTSVSH